MNTGYDRLPTCTERRDTGVSDRRVPVFSVPGDDFL